MFQKHDDVDVMDDDTQMIVAPSQVMSGSRKRGQKTVVPPTHVAPTSSTPLEIVSQTPIASTQPPSAPTITTPFPHLQQVSETMLVLPPLSCCHVCLLYGRRHPYWQSWRIGICE